MQAQMHFQRYAFGIRLVGCNTESGSIFRHLSSGSCSQSICIVLLHVEKVGKIEGWGEFDCCVNSYKAKK